MTGASGTASRQLAAEGLPVGILNQQGSGYSDDHVAAYRWWGADNGCFTEADFSEPRWWAWLLDQDPTRCLFATAPDVVGDHPATVARSASWLPRIRDAGYPAAFVAQDGITPDDTPWDTFDCLFVGGRDGWKLGPDCATIMAEARSWGKWIHVGRVNSWRRIHRAYLLGADSADGNVLRYGPDTNINRIRSWLSRIASSPSFDQLTR